MGEAKLFPLYCKPPETDEEIAEAMAPYITVGAVGCIGSMDCTMINWPMLGTSLKHLHIGKSGFPTRSFEMVLQTQEESHLVPLVLRFQKTIKLL